jgi:DNA polymerase III subunit chi
MAEIGFYHLQRSTLEQALPRLLERVFTSGLRAVVLAGSTERVESLDRTLWTFGKDSFLPHGSRADGHPGEQPIWLTERLENPNGATVLVLVEGMDVEDLSGFERCLDLFDGNDDDAVRAARERWRRRREAGHRLVYWQQGERGGWRKAFEHGGAGAG